MLDRAELAKTEGVTPEQAEQATLSAIPAAAVQSDPALRAALETLREKDPSLKIREAAREALAAPRR
jgi:hypothetical protein